MAPPQHPFQAAPQPAYQPSYVPHPQPAAPVGRAHAIGPLSVVLALLLAASVFTQLFAANTVSERADLIGELRLINSVDESTLQRALEVDDKVGRAAALSSLSWVVCGVLWIVWQRRFVRNGSRFGPISPPLGWGTWGWFVPFAGYYLPQAQLANAARRTDPHQLLGKSGIAPPILYVWWVLFGAANMSTLAARLSAGDAATALIEGGFSLGSFHDAIDRLERADQLATLSFWLSAGAALMGAATVLVCTDNQRKLLTALGVKS
jgi:hypothetical protein